MQRSAIHRVGGTHARIFGSGTVDGRNPANHLECIKPIGGCNLYKTLIGSLSLVVVNNGINYLSTGAADFFHQQYESVDQPLVPSPNPEGRTMMMMMINKAVIIEQGSLNYQFFWVDQTIQM